MTTRKVLNQDWELDFGEWERASGTALADAAKYTVIVKTAPILSQK